LEAKVPFTESTGTCCYLPRGGVGSRLLNFLAHCPGLVLRSSPVPHMRLLNFLRIWPIEDRNWGALIRRNAYVALNCNDDWRRRRRYGLGSAEA